MVETKIIETEIDYFQKNLPFVDLVTTYQGEGPNCGKRMTLVRFKYCNKACPFCDTQKMMKDVAEEKYSLKDVALHLNNSNGLMITGGEPTLSNQRNDNCLTNFHATITMLRELNYQWADVETNGFQLEELLTEIDTMNPRNGINVSWSPKFISKFDYKTNISNAELVYKTKIHRIKPILKLVISKEDNEYKKFLYDVVNYKIIPTAYIYLMPLGVSYDEINDSMDECLKISSELSCNISSRLQILHKFP